MIQVANAVMITTARDRPVFCTTESIVIGAEVVVGAPGVPVPHVDGSV